MSNFLTVLEALSFIDISEDLVFNFSQTVLLVYLFLAGI